MTLPATVDRLEDLPEAVRPHYVATEDGRWRLDAEGIEDAVGLKAALEAERAARDPAPESRPEPESPEPPSGADPGDAGPEADAGAGDPRLAALEARLIDSEVLAALQAARGVPELLLPVLRNRLAVLDDGAGNPAVRVLDDAGTPRRRDDGGFVTVADLVESLRADPVYGRAFEASGKGGSGAPTAGRGEAGPLTVSADDPRAIARHVADIAAGRVRVA